MNNIVLALVFILFSISLIVSRKAWIEIFSTLFTVIFYVIAVPFVIVAAIFAGLNDARVGRTNQARKKRNQDTVRRNCRRASRLFVGTLLLPLSLLIRVPGMRKATQAGLSDAARAKIRFRTSVYNPRCRYFFLNPVALPRAIGLLFQRGYHRGLYGRGGHKTVVPPPPQAVPTKSEILASAKPVKAIKKPDHQIMTVVLP